MMNTTSSDSTSADQNGGAFAIVFGVSVGALSLIAIIIFTSYFCARKRAPADPNSSFHAGSYTTDDQDSDVALELGLDESTLNSYPKLLYSQAKSDKVGENNSSLVASCCSICLAEYKDSDVLRLLPACDHLFHIECVDPWLKLNSSCPLCRNTPVQTPRNLPAETTDQGESRPLQFDPWLVVLMH